MLDHPNFVRTTMQNNWVVRWVTQDLLLAATLVQFDIECETRKTAKI